MQATFITVVRDKTRERFDLPNHFAARHRFSNLQR
jgi:hypothetical protein